MLDFFTELRGTREEGIKLSVLSIINQKGGVAKTTTAVNVAHAWAKLGKKVLLVDLDPQASATRSIFGDREFDYTSFDLVLNQKPVKEIIQHSEGFGVDVIPGEILLSGVDIQLAAQFGREKFLRKSLVPVKSQYDAIIIDCSPTLGLLTVNALMASQEIIIPICPEYFSLKGIELITDTLNNIRSGLGHSVHIKGIVITRFKNRKVIKSVIEKVTQTYGLRVFSEFIPDNIVVEEAHHNHLPVAKYAPRSKAAKSYDALAQELLV